MSANFLLALPLLLPILCGLLLLRLKSLRLKSVRRPFLTAVLAINSLITFMVIMQPNIYWQVISPSPMLTLLFKVDDLSRLFAGLISVIWLIVGIYALGYMDYEENQRSFFFFYLLTLSALLALSFAGNYMTLYLCFELMTLASVPLVLHSLTPEAIAAAMKYLFYSIAGATLALMGFFLMVNYGYTIEFIPGGALDPQRSAGHELLLQVGALLAIIGYGTKAGLFPMHSWLPTAHPVAPSPASAVLSGVITKAGILAVIRIIHFQFGAAFIRGTWVQYTWLTLCLITVFMGSILAFKEKQLKKRLAYSSVSQVSYILFGLALLNSGGMLGALLHLVFHAIIKNGLFMAIGTIILLTHKTKMGDIAGIGRQMPLLMTCFSLLALALVGIPPSSGAISKWQLAISSLAAATGKLAWLGPVILLTSALLTAGYLLSLSIHGFFSHIQDQQLTSIILVDKLMLLPIIILTLPAIGLGLFPGALINLISLITAGLF